MINAIPELVLRHETPHAKEKVWAAFASAATIGQWWGASGFTTEVKRYDFVTGGVFHYVMRAPALELWGRWVFGPMNAPDSLVFSNSFSDATGAIVRAPFNPLWPLVISNQLSVTEAEGRTTLTLRASPQAANPIECQVFSLGMDSIRAGFASTWQQLDAYLARTP